MLAAQFKEPEDEWVRFLTTRVYEGSFTQRIRDQFVPLVSKAARQFLNEQVNDRLKNALGGPDSYVSVTPDESSAAPPEVQGSGDAPRERTDEVATSEEELEGYRVVRAIVCGEVSPARIVARDTKSYFGILLDDNNRKPVARLWFNRSKKYLGLFDEHKAETRIPIARVEDIYQHADQLRTTVARYLADSRLTRDEELPVAP